MRVFFFEVNATNSTSFCGYNCGMMSIPEHPEKSMSEPTKLRSEAASIGQQGVFYDDGPRWWLPKQWKRLRVQFAQYRREIGLLEEAIEIQKRWLGDLSSKRVLDLGAGDGNVLTMYIARSCKEYVAVDLSAKRIAILQEKLLRAGLAHAIAEVRDAMAEDWPHGEFDVIYCSSVLNAFRDTDSAIRMLKRRLHRGGIVVAWEPLKTSWLNIVIRGLYRPFQPDRAWHWPLSRQALRRYASEFEVKAVHGLLGWSKWGFPFYVCPWFRGLGIAIGRRLAGLDRKRAARLGRGLWGCHQDVLVLEKSRLN
jgi:SAM-dependent methyltransferase